MYDNDIQQIKPDDLDLAQFLEFQSSDNPVALNCPVDALHL